MFFMVVPYYLSSEYWKKFLQDIIVSWRFFKGIKGREDLSFRLEDRISNIPHFLEHLEYVRDLYVEYKSAPDWRIRAKHREEVMRELEVLLKFTYTEHKEIREYLQDKKRSLEEDESRIKDHEKLVAYGGGSTPPIPNSSNGKRVEETLDYQI